ncbi:hypothetical protein QE422_000976 [Chryseobacterium sp. SORGH_AS 447]|uniref:hypothetical protein n=1 Tax=Chryseobacterium sp. SORGH_AS_0447 TaxID=3041769 RepID=UPI00277FB2FE|nr:hypothetical protein [Chryseobacterium sp. SORGH_AS_0447]MDQ1160608.1 hypothetical protein [Chryseobacterium sp. SORGH_AS_0447]
MKKIVINFIMTALLIIVQYFLSIILIFQIAAKRVGEASSGFKDILIVLIWLGGLISIIYFFIKFLTGIYRYKE